MQKITPFLWFDEKAQEAASFYVNVFSNNPEVAPGGNSSKMGKITYYNEPGARASGRQLGSVMTVEFELDGQQFIALNGGPHFKFSGAISFVINCRSQEEIDYFWEKFSEHGESGQCGWINRDKFGITWQIVPNILEQYLSDPDPKKSKRVMEAMLGMKKIIIEDLRNVHQQE